VSLELNVTAGTVRDMSGCHVSGIFRPGRPFRVVFRIYWSEAGRAQGKESLKKILAIYAGGPGVPISID